jgi:hypothetical protein
MSAATTKATYLETSRQRIRNRGGSIAPEPRVKQYFRRQNQPYDEDTQRVEPPTA